MNKITKNGLLLLAGLFILIGFKSAFMAVPYTELTGVQTIKGNIYKLHCPQNGAAALSLKDDEITYNLSIKFRSNYCDDEASQPLLGIPVTLKAVQVSDGYYQVYEMHSANKALLTAQEVESDRSSSTFGLFLLAFLLIALVVYKSKKK